jgi:uncharacterized DUF497 family protein
MAIWFTWDPRKAAANRRKHGVSFEEAQTVFLDEQALVVEDPDHSETEERFILVGLSSAIRVLTVVHCERSHGDEIRIISARKATRREQNEYWRRT